jgi:hypothetical protein
VDDDYQADPAGQSLTRPQMEYDVLSAGKKQLVVVQSPTLDDVINVLESLDQQSHTAMTLIDDSGAYISVGGGSGQYHVYVGALDHDDRVILQSPEPEPDAPGQVRLVNDGRTERYPAHDVVDRDAVRAALTEFHRGGRPSLGLSWRAG